MGSRFWNLERRARLIELAARGFDVNGIAAALSTSRGSICTYAGREKIEIPGEEAFKRERNRAWWRERARKEKEKKLAEQRIGTKAAGSAHYDHSQSAPQLTKRDLQTFLAEAVRNTCAMQASQ